MGAFMVSRKHIAVLVTAARAWGISWRNSAGAWVTARDADPAELGRLLWAENMASVTARYPDTVVVGGPQDGAVKLADLPGTIGESYQYETHRDVALPSAVAVLKLCGCYDYQSCEHEGWEASEARKVVEAIRDTGIGRLPGYDEASWDL